MTRVVKTLKIVALILASKFENFRDLPSKDLEDDLALILVLEPRHCSRFFWESLKLLKVIFSQGYSNRGHLTTIFSPYLFSGMRKQGGFWVHNSFWPPLSALHQNFQQNSVQIELVHPQYLILSYEPVYIIFWKNNFWELHENPRK